MQQRINFASFVAQDKIIYFNFKVAALLITVILFSCSSFYSFRLYEVQRKKYELRHLDQKKQDLAKKIIALNGQITLQEKQSQSLQQQKGKKRDNALTNQGFIDDYIQKQIKPHVFVKLFEVLSKHSHSNLWLTQFNFTMEGYHYTLQGKAESDDIVTRFVEGLQQEAVPGLEEIKIIELNYLQNGLVSFKVSS